jgi:hypothetical protein
MVNFTVGVAAVEELLCHDPRMVGSHHPCGVKGHGDGLFSNQLFQLLIGSPIMLHVADVFHVNLLGVRVRRLVLTHIVLHLMVVAIVRSLQDTVL